MSTIDHERVKAFAKELIDAERRGFDRGWAACEAKYRSERDALGRRLESMSVESAIESLRGAK
jgi:hypothetical protein